MKYFTFRRVFQNNNLNIFFSIAYSSIATTIVVLIVLYIAMKIGYIPEEQITSGYHVLIATLCLLGCISVGQTIQWYIKAKAECYIDNDKTIVLNYINNGNKIRLLPQEIDAIYLMSRKTLWGTYQNVVIEAKSKLKPLKLGVIELPLQEPQKFIDEVEKIRKSSK